MAVITELYINHDTKKTGLLPTSCNDIRAMLGAFELVAGSRLQLGEIVRAESPVHDA